MHHVMSVFFIFEGLSLTENCVNYLDKQGGCGGKVRYAFVERNCIYFVYF